MHTDPIADMLTRIRNGGHAKLASVDIPSSRVKKELARILQAEGLITSYEVITEGKFEALRVNLKYHPRAGHAISHVRRISKPGLRVYKTAKEITPLRSGLGLRIISTSQGIVTDRDARRRNIGGEIMCEVW